MKWPALIVCAGVLIGCSDSGTSSAESIHISIENDKEHNGMILISTQNSTVRLGAKLKANFTYDFSIDKHEVTCGDFAKLVKNHKCENAELPVTNITFFDAD